ncbi:MAG: universal stress protein [Acidobacteriota bacterium]
MLIIKHILFPQDFSEQSRDVAVAVRKLACQFGAEVTMMSVLPPIWEQLGVTFESGGAFGAIEAPARSHVDMEELKAGLDARLAATATRELVGVPVRRIVETGDPAESIVAFAQSEGADLIMMATRGHGPFRSLLLGSVAAKVLHDAHCPVWTSAHASEPVVARPAQRNILCAVDGTPKTVPVMEWAAEWASAVGGTLRLVHAIPGMQAWPDRQMNHEFEAALMQQARETIERQQQAAGIGAALGVGTGDIAAVVREEALRHSSDLVVIGRGLLDGTFGRLRTHSYGIIRLAPCPVISV